MSREVPDLRRFERKGQSKPPLDGIRVVDFTRVLAGPFGTQILGDLGAEVIKIENPLGGDDTRAISPQAALAGEAPFFLSLNRSKQSVAVDLKREDGRRVVLDLIATADILVENFSGAVMRRFELDYSSLKARFPKLIYCSVSGYGRTGRNADTPGFDSPVGAEAGVMSLNAYAGSAPVLGAVPYTDITTALNATIAILAALQARARDGIGQFVDVAMFDSALANLSYSATEYLVTGKEPRLNTAQSLGPRGVFDTEDGRIIITAGSDKMFRSFCAEVAGRPEWLDDARFGNAAGRFQNADALLPEIREIFLGHTSENLAEKCRQAGIPCGVVRTAGQAVMSEQAIEREMVVGLPHPAGLVPAIAQPFQFSETPCRYVAAPLLGQHTETVLRELLGYDAEKIQKLVASGAIALGRDTSDTQAGI